MYTIYIDGKAVRRYRKLWHAGLHAAIAKRQGSPVKVEKIRCKKTPDQGPR